MARRLKILYIITGLGNGGAERQLFNLVKAMSKSADVKVVSFTGGEYEDAFKKRKIEVGRIPASLIRGLKGLRAEVHSFKPDIVHSFLPHANIAAKLLKIFSSQRFKLICSVRGTGNYWFRHVIERLLDFASDSITTNSGAIRSFLTKRLRYPQNKIVTIYNGYEFIEATADKEFYPKKRKIITVANFTPEKDWPTNIATARLVCKKRKDVVFIYVGTGKKRMMRAQQAIREHGLQDRVIFLGRRDDVPRLLTSSDIFFMPTVSEGQSNAVLEAMHYGCPVVSTDIEANTEIIQDGKEGVLLPVREPKLMAKAIMDLLDNSRRYADIKRRAQDKADSFTLARMLKAYQKLYAEVLRC